MDRQERAAAKYRRFNNHSAAMLLSEHCAAASAACQLANGMSRMQLADYCCFATMLDGVQSAYPKVFCMRALMHVAHARLDAGMAPADIINMFSLKAQKRTAQFKALSPRLQDIMSLQAADAEKALVDGLFSTVLLNFLNLPNGMYPAILAAETLREACNTASLMEPAGPTGPSIMADPSGVAGSSSTIPAKMVWLDAMQDIAGAIICVTSSQHTQEDMDQLMRVQNSKTGSRKLVRKAFLAEPWLTMSQDTLQFAIGNLTIVPQVQAALRTCAVDPAAWVKVAASIPAWRSQVRPGTTLELEEMLLKVLLDDWTHFDATDQPGSDMLLKRLRLARPLAPANRPDTDCIDLDCTDLMESIAPRPQLIMPAPVAGLSSSHQQS